MPRSLLYHRCAFDSKGLITEAKIVPPASKNQKRIEDDLWNLAPKIISLPQPEVTLRYELAIRNYDPCISYATHFLKLRVDRD